jgi:small conductance mechanosensitive channel
MERLENVLAAVRHLIPLLATLAMVVAVLVFARWFLLRRRAAFTGEGQVTGQIIVLILTALSIVAIVLVLPVSGELKGQLLTLLGLALTLVIALSSTTFAANAMAGFMLRTERSFRPGDFIRVGNQMGRVTERGLFHTEIQTEDRDLTTLPNMYLVSNPVTVVRSSGTIVSARVSLSYDIARSRVEPLMKAAAERADLQEPFVQVTALGDYAVTYRVAGFLPDVKQLLTARSRLRKRILDTLHGEGIEIASPSIMLQRPLPPEREIIPAEAAAPPEVRVEEAPEALIFDKAEEAEEIELLRLEREELNAQIDELKKQLKEADDPLRSELQRELDVCENRREAVDAALQASKEIKP